LDNFLEVGHFPTKNIYLYRLMLVIARCVQFLCMGPRDYLI